MKTPSIILHRRNRRATRALGAAAAMLLAMIALLPRARAQSLAGAPVQALKKMSLDELMAVEVTSVSRQPEKLSEAASAIQVITGEDIRRSGATSLPEALRLAPNLQVAQVNASQWAISARGFNNVLANKLLVMIDGRTVYTPLYAGVFWDVQDTLLEDVDRIEVISGPGGTLWGANAVNGVINITTKSAKDTQGLFVEGAAGNEIGGFGGVRYGAELAPDLHLRVYGKSFQRDSTILLDGSDAQDDWRMSQGGFRLDWDPGEKNSVTLQGDAYDGRPDPDGGSPVIARGGNVLGRWKHTLSETSDFQFQLYYDRTWRDFGNGFAEGLSTYDLDAQHRFQLGANQVIIWGVGARAMEHHVDNVELLKFLPADKTLNLYSAFVQDEVAFADRRLHLTLGSKFEHNDYTGLEFQPSLRLAWTPVENQTLWAAVSRAVRTPSRTDTDFQLLLTPAIGLLSGNPDFDSEKLIAYELGWRTQPLANLSLSLSTFYNEYNDLRSAQPGPPPFGLPILIGNDVQGDSYGVEFAATYQVTTAWRLHGGATFFKKHLSVKPGAVDLNGATAESDDPESQLQLQSSVDLPHNFEWDVIGRYVTALPKPYAPAYVGLDLRFAWKPTASLELQLVGQNLLDRAHPEFVPSSPTPREIERAVYGKIIWRY